MTGLKNIWAYDPERCDGDYCPMDCDICQKADGAAEEEGE